MNPIVQRLREISSASRAGGGCQALGLRTRSRPHAGSSDTESATALVSPELAPARWQSAIERMLCEHPFERNAFAMTRFPWEPADEADPVAALLDMARAVLRAHGLTLHLASDRKLDDDLHGNVFAHVWACCFGIAVFENRMGTGLNHNMIAEVGAMLNLGRRCLLLRDTTVDRMPTDFLGLIYEPIDLEDPRSAALALHRWAAVDLGLGPCRACGAKLS